MGGFGPFSGRFSRAKVRLYDGTTIRRGDFTTLRRYDEATLRRGDFTTRRRYDEATIRRYDWTIGHGLQGPVFGFVGHVDEHGDDVFVFVVEIVMFFFVDIFCGEGIIEPNLSFGGFSLSIA